MINNYGELWTINPDIRTDNTDAQVLYFFFKRFDDFEMFFYAIGNRDDKPCIGEIQNWETIVNPALSTLMDLMSNRVLYASDADMTCFWNKMTNYVFEGHKASFYYYYSQMQMRNRGGLKSHADRRDVKYIDYSKFKSISHADDEEV